MESARYKTPAILAATVGLILVIYSKTLIWLFTAWWSDPYYSHGVLVPLISGYLIWSKRAELAELPKEPSGLGIPVIVAGLLIHGVGIFRTIRFASAISIVIVLAGIILFIYGNDVMKSLLFPVSFLIFMAPIPFAPVIGAALQAPSAGLAATLVSALGIPATVTGAEIRLTECAFDVGAPCSGLRSIISLLTLAALYAYLLEGSIVMKAAVFLSALPIAIAANVLRITSILLVANAYGSDVAMRFFHDFSSLLLFSISLIGLLIIGRCFGSLRFKRIF
jgi:exosortase